MNRSNGLISYITSTIASNLVSDALAIAPITIGSGTPVESKADRSKRLKRERDRRYREAKRVKSSNLEAVSA